MKRISLVLAVISLLLLCGCGDTAEKSAAPVEEAPVVEELPDARVLWQEAENAVSQWDSVDVDVSTVASADIRGLKQTMVQQTRIKGRDLNGEKPVYQAISTGDMPSEAYYSDGWLYVSGAFGNYKEEMDIEGLLDYLGEGSLEVGPESFEDVSLISQENGWKLAFSVPREDFVSAFKETFESEEMSYKDGSLEVIGGVELTEDGELDRVAMDITAVFLMEGEEITLSVKTGERVLDREETRITLPSKLKLYMETDDCDLPEKLYNALVQLEEATAVDFEARMDFKGDLSGRQSDLGESQHGYMQIDPETLLPRYLSEWTNWYNGVEQDHYVMDFNGDTVTYTRKDFTTSDTITEKQIWDALLNDLYCYCTADEMKYYTGISGEGEDGLRIAFTPSQELCENLLDYFMYIYMDFGTYEKFMTDSKYDLRSSSGTVVLDGEGRLVSMEFTADISRTAVNGQVVDGTLSYSKTFCAFDEDVTLPTEAPEEMLSVA